MASTERGDASDLAAGAALPAPEAPEAGALANGTAPREVAAPAEAVAVPRTRPRLARAGAALWHSRAVLLGGLALGCALYGQKVVTDARGVADGTGLPAAVVEGIRWYTAAIVLMILAWLGTYKNRTFLRKPSDRAAGAAAAAARASSAGLGPRRFARLAAFSAVHPRVTMALRYALALAGLALNLYGTQQLRTHAFDSAIGGWCWLISLGMLVAAFAWQRAPSRGAGEAAVAAAPADTAGGLPRWAEIAIFLGIFAIGLGLRLYRLGDWTTGMHGDEGEAGVDALGILAGNGASPFATGWFSQPNFYYWGIALTMRVFGTDLFGLRMFAALAGSLMLIPFYPLVRQWFGVRGAIIATFLLAVSDVAIHFSKQEFSNITTPLFLVTGFFFFFRGLRDRRLINFVLAGYAHILSMYFYLGGRLTPILVIAFLAYLFLLLPLVRLPGAYQAIRRRLPGLGRGGAAARAVAAEARGVAFYGHQIVVYILACIFFISPWLAYFVDHQAEWNSRADEKLILNNAALMVQQYGVQHGPLYLGVRPPTPGDIWPLPLVFEQTPVSIRLLPLPWESAAAPNANPLLQDGFWARAMWRQLTATLSILTYRGDASSVYTFTSEPVAKPIEAALIILGLAWAAWRWRDTRMALLTLWFWSTVLVGGVLTIDAPYMARLVGVIPTLAVFAMLPLDKLATEMVRLAGRVRRPARLPRVALAFSSVAIAALLVFLGAENYTDYFDRYEAQIPAPFAEVTGQAYFVRQVNTALAQAGRPPAKFYDVGAHLIYWGHGDNRFLNNGVEGLDMVNASNELPIVENGPDNASDVYFMVWGLDQQYLSVLRAYYPDAVEIPYYYPSATHGTLLFTAVHVTREQIDARRVLQATYTPAQGAPVQRQETALGTSAPPPDGLAYPVQARWTGSLVAPAFGRYRFAITGPPGAQLLVDGIPAVTARVGGSGDGEWILARGVHTVLLTATLAGADTAVQVTWAPSGQALAPVAARFLWAGPGRGLTGEIRPLTAQPFGPLPEDTAGQGAAPVIARRIDGFLGFRDASTGLSGGVPLVGDWHGTLNVPRDGTYQFSAYSNGDSLITIDGQPVVDNRTGGTDVHQRDGSIALTQGAHAFDLRYVWSGNIGYLEVYWTPPDGERVLLGPDSLQTDGGIWPPGTVTEPGIVSPTPPGSGAGVVPAEAILDVADTLDQPRGLAVGPDRTLYIADAGSHQVVVLDKNARRTATWGKQGTGPGEFSVPEDVGVGPDGRLYVLDSDLHRVSIFQPDGTFVRDFGADILCTSAGMDVGPDGRVYVADTCNGRVRVFTADGVLEHDVTAGADPATRLDQPVDVAVGSDGTVFVADLRNRVIRIDPATDAIVQSWPLPIGTSLGAANLAVLGDWVYVTDPDRNRLDVINVVTGAIAEIGAAGTGSGQFSSPLGIAADANGLIYVVDSGNRRVQVFDGGRLAP